MPEELDEWKGVEQIFCKGSSFFPYMILFHPLYTLLELGSPILLLSVTTDVVFLFVEI